MNNKETEKMVHKIVQSRIDPRQTYDKWIRSILGSLCYS
jgi:hypothetical protein